MLIDADDADGKPADVYSLGKLIWRLASGQRYPLPGSHDRAISAMTIGAYVSRIDTATLDALLEGMTQIDPRARPAMAEVVASLEVWLAPAPSQSDEVDLKPFARRISDLTADRRRTAARNAAARTAVEKELKRLHGLLWPDLAKIAKEFQDNVGNQSSQRTWLGGAEGPPMILSAATDGPRISLHRLEISTRIHTGVAVVDLAAVFHLLLALSDEGVEDTAMPVALAAGYRTRQPSVGIVAYDFPWRDEGHFRLGFPDERAVVDRLLSGMRRNLGGALEFALHLLEQDSGTGAS
jgi:hypothetical protein